MGSAAAWWLTRRGRDVVVLERFEQGHHNGSSHGGSRIFRFAYADPMYVDLAKNALPLWRELEDETGQTLLETTGGVDHGDPRMVDTVASALDKAGATYERLDPDAARERWPAMRFDRTVVYQPDAGRALADRTVRALHDLVGPIHFNEPVERIDVRDDGVRVQTSVDEYEAPVAIVAAGAWVAKLLDGLVALPPLTVTREQVFYFRPREDQSWPSFIHHRTPWIYGLDTPGVGVKVAEHHTGAVVDADTRMFDVDDAGRERVVDHVREWFRGLEPEPVNAETCLYTTTPDENFFIERVGPIVAVSACSGHGFKFTPIIGRMAADLATT